MEMTAEEICVSYRQAKSPDMQIKILAELNCCRIRDIESVLGKEYMNRQGRYTEFERLYNEGLTDSEISKRLQCPRQNVYAWRIRRGKPSNSRRRRHGKVAVTSS